MRRNQIREKEKGFLCTINFIQPLSSTYFSHNHSFLLVPMSSWNSAVQKKISNNSEPFVSFYDRF